MTRRIAALERALQLAHRQLHQDDLTPLLNRRGLRHAWDRRLGPRNADVATCCVMIDLDGFKRVNDLHGHLVGDAALLHFAATLRRHVRDADAIARLGGDEFVLVLRHCALADVQTVLDRLQRVLAVSPLETPDGCVYLKFSAGVATRRSGELLAQVLARADIALFEAKRRRKEHVSLPTACPRPDAGA